MSARPSRSISLLVIPTHQPSSSSFSFSTPRTHAHRFGSGLNAPFPRRLHHHAHQPSFLSHPSNPSSPSPATATAGLGSNNSNNSGLWPPPSPLSSAASSSHHHYTYNQKPPAAPTPGQAPSSLPFAAFACLETTTRLLLPAWSVGRIIGKGGDVITSAYHTIPY